MRHAIVLFVCGLYSGINGCSDGSSGDSAPAVPFELRILNSSQFELQEIYLQNDEQEYQDTESVISQALGVGGVYSKMILQQTLRVTVTRETFAGGPLHAYTTAPALAIGAATQIEYLDDQFRVTNYVRGE